MRRNKHRYSLRSLRAMRKAVMEGERSNQSARFAPGCSRRGRIAGVAKALALCVTVFILMWIIVRDRDGREVARIEVSDRHTVQMLGTDVPSALPLTGADASPSAAPPSADAPPAKAPPDAPPVVAGPEWLAKHHGQLNGKEYEIAVKSGLYVTIPECQRALEAAEKQATLDYLDNYLDEGAGDLVNLDGRYIHEHFQRQEYLEAVQATIGPMQQMHALLVFDDKARSDFHDRWRQALVTRRLWYVGSGAALVLTALATAYGYLAAGAKPTVHETVPR